MDKYDYKSAVLNDVREYLAEHCSAHISDAERDRLEEDMWAEDSVTGNGSGSYFFSTWKAEEALCHNLDLLEEACSEFGDELGSRMATGPESCDVTIRCYLLHEAVGDAVEEWNESHAEDDWDKE